MINGLAHAQTAPTVKPATKTEFSAGSAECRQELDNGNVCTYRQDAKFIDPDTKLWAPTIVVYRDQNNQMIKIQAFADKEGHKAYYQGLINPENTKKQNDKNTTPINANANIITMYPPKNLMVLEGQAVATRNHDTITGSYLEYDIVKQTILAKPKEKELTTIVFHPKNSTEEQAP